MVVHKPTFEPIKNLLKSLCKRDLANSAELEHRQNCLANISINKTLPNLCLAPIPTNEDLTTISRLSAKPNFDYAIRLFKSLDRELINQLQPAALDFLIKSCANVNKLKSIDSKADIAIRLDLATKIFGQLEDREALTSQYFVNLITLCGLAGNLQHAKILFENYCQIRFDNLKSDATLNPLYHDHQLQPPLTLTLNQSTSSSNQITNSHLADKKSDSQVLLALMLAYLVNGDSVSAVTLSEQSLSPTIDQASSNFKSDANHILEIILGFIRLNEYASASKWIKRLINGDHAFYHLDNPGCRQEFMDQIVRLACEPGRGAPGLGVAYDAAMISIDQIDSQFDTKAMGAVMARKKQVGHLKSTIEMFQDSLKNASSIVCYIIIKQSALLKADSTKFEAILDLQTYGSIENISKCVIQSCQAIKNQCITNPSKDLMHLGFFSEDLLTRLIHHYSILPDIRDLQTATAEFRHQSSYLTGLLTSYQSVLQSPIAAIVTKLDQQLQQCQLAFGFKITTPIILNNLILVPAMQFYQLYSSCPDAERCLSSINDWIVLLTVSVMLQAQAKEGKVLPSIQTNLPMDSQDFIESALGQFENFLANSDAHIAQFNSNYDIEFLLEVFSTYKVKMPTQGRAQASFSKMKSNNVDEELKAKAHLRHCIEEGDKYFSNCFGLLRDQNSTGKVPLSSPTSFDSALLSRSTSFANSSISPPTLSSIHTNTSSQFTQPAVPVPHTPFQSYNDHLSQLALSMFCSKDLIQLNRLYNAVHQSTLQGHYLTADASSALIKTYGRHRQIDRVREMYFNGHVALASPGSASASDQALKSISRTRVEDRMIIALAYCGLLEELAIHKN
ncbi:hypothetical protein O181_063097 [Austropuccinia psidii MF-1]|uniref:Uncharacterized protein n=1 Tax=Austropuccinia psidii MF-1 TaxID=1389203 RepID=A0A9Q3ETE0_9BASI|nr:hypothetical protein [Austropuccinia psidii MF-1]